MVLSLTEGHASCLVDFSGEKRQGEDELYIFRRMILWRWESLNFEFYDPKFSKVRANHAEKSGQRVQISGLLLSLQLTSINSTCWLGELGSDLNAKQFPFLTNNTAKLLESDDEGAFHIQF